MNTGDSISAGYGNECGGKSERFKPATENAFMAYGVRCCYWNGVLASRKCQQQSGGSGLCRLPFPAPTGAVAGRAFDAETRIIAWSGKGLLANSDGSTVETMPVCSAHGSNPVPCVAHCAGTETAGVGGRCFGAGCCQHGSQQQRSGFLRAGNRICLLSTS